MRRHTQGEWRVRHWQRLQKRLLKSEEQQGLPADHGDLSRGGTNSSLGSEGTNFSDALILKFKLPESWENKCPLFYPSSLGNCPNSPRKSIHWEHLNFLYGSLPTAFVYIIEQLSSSSSQDIFRFSCTFPQGELFLNLPNLAILFLSPTYIYYKSSRILYFFRSVWTTEVLYIFFGWL